MTAMSYRSVLVHEKFADHCVMARKEGPFSRDAKNDEASEETSLRRIK
jgi:hypothetical protein